MKTWKKTNDYYNRDVIKCDIWSYKVSERTTIYLMDGNYFTFTVSSGANSNNSYTGCFFGHPEITNVEQAKEAIKIKHPNYFK